MAENRHTDTLPLGSRPGKVERRRDVQRFQPTGTPVSAPTTWSAKKLRPSSLGHPTSARRSLFNQRRAAQSSSDAPARAGPPSEFPAPRDSQAVPMATDPEPVRVDIHGDTREAPLDPPEATMETDLEPTHVGTHEGTRDAPPPTAGPMETDGPSSGGQARVPSQPSTPRSWPRNTAPTHPSGMWFCPITRCARREGASPTGWGCLQSLVSQLRSVHLSMGAAPPDAWLDTHGLRACLAAGKSPRKGRGARDHAATRRS